MSYEIKYGESVVDAVFNSTGDISAWSDFLNLNNFDSWTPPLFAGEIVNTPSVVLPDIQTVLQIYPSCNISINDVYAQIDVLFDLLATSTPSTPPVIQPPIIPIQQYTVNYSDTITDVVFNGTGTIDKWADVLSDNNFDTWTPDLYAGQIISLQNATGININVKRDLAIYPSNNHSVNGIYGQINIIFDLLNNPTADWILYNPDGYWNDTNHYWRDGAFWLD